MGGSQQGPGGSDAVLQTLGPYGGVWGHPAAYGGQAGWVYVLESAGGGYLRALSYGVNGQGVPSLSSAATSAETFGYTSGSPLVTSNGTTAGSAVVWVVYASGPSGAKGELRAYSAAPSGGELPLLWSARIGTASKFEVPTAYGGRVYVGTRNGWLTAYGTTTAGALRAAPVQAGSVPVGQSRTETLSITATRKLSITAPLKITGEEGVPGSAHTALLRSARAASHTAGPKAPPSSGTAPIARSVFAVQQPRAGTQVAAGSTIRLRVRFAPAHAGPVVGMLSIPTSAGTRTVTVSGYGTAPGLLLSAAPLSFGEIDTGSGGKSLSFTFSNSSDRPETLTSYRAPGSPYTLTGMPAPGTVLAPRQAVTASLHFEPSRAGSYPANLSITTDQGTAALAVSGEGVTGVARLAVSTAVIDAGSVPVGDARTVTFLVGNAGNVPLRISRAIAPLGAFSAADPLPEGIRLDPGTFIRQSVTFAPQQTGPASGVYRFNANDGQGYVTVTLTGTGT